MRHLWFALLLGIMPVSACHAQTATEDPVRPVIAQWSRQHGGGAAPAMQMLRSVDEWNAFWRQVERESPRPLDTTREMAAVIQLGEKRTGGFSAEVVGARTQEGKLVIDYRESAPEPGMMVAQALTSPWTVAILPRSDLPIIFRNVAAAAKPARREK